LILAPAGDPALKPASDTVVDNRESGDEAVMRSTIGYRAEKLPWKRIKIVLMSRPLPRT